MNKKIIFTNGCFDILHVGHLRYLQASKNLVPEAKLIVGLNSDSSVKALKGDSRPINNQEDRAELLMALEPVDEVIIFDEMNALKVLEKVKPDIYTKGADYDLEDYTKCPEFKFCHDNNTEVNLIKLEDGYSTSNTIVKMES